MKFCLILNFVICILFFIGCKKSTTPLTSSQVSLTAEYVGVKEAEFRLQVESSQPYDTFQLIRDEQTVLAGPLFTVDTLLLDTTLSPSHTYTYQANLFYNARKSLTSQEVTLSTMDTTSHNFQWEIFTIGSPFGSGALYDVAIIDENNIWAVGEIYADSAQPWLPYNAVHWDGQLWELKRIPYIHNGQPFYHPMNFTFSFANGEVWFGGNGIVKWDGNRFSNVEINPNAWGSVAINKAWGASPENVYIVGNRGSIAQYNGQNWQKLESGTELPIQDIWGAKNPTSGEELILCVASRLDQNEGRELLKIHNQEVEKLQVDGLSWSLKAIWFIPDIIYYIGGDGLYPSRNLDAPWKRDVSFPQLYKHAISGQAVNDIVVAGSFGLLSHFNGVNWRHFSGGNLPSSSAAYRGVSIQGDVMAAVGYHNLRNGIVVLGRRN